MPKPTFVRPADERGLGDAADVGGEGAGGTLGEVEDDGPDEGLVGGEEDLVLEWHAGERGMGRVVHEVAVAVEDDGPVGGGRQDAAPVDAFADAVASVAALLQALGDFFEEGWRDRRNQSSFVLA